MRVCVIGAGLAGLTAAYHLAGRGHDVVVLDRAEREGTGASFANGGQLSYGYVAPLAAPGVLRKAAGWLLDGEAPMRMRAQADPRLWRWLFAFARASRRSAFEAGTRDMLRLAEHSRTVLASMMEQDDLAFSYRRNGKLVAFRSERELAGAADLVAYQARHGARQELLDAKACLALEPALVHLSGRLVGGVHTPDEAVGDAFLFCGALRRSLSGDGRVSFSLGTSVTSLEVVGGRVAALRTTRGPFEADHYVAANGIDALGLLAPLGIHLPLYPLKGYSLTVPVEAGHAPPSVSVTDAGNKVVYATLSDPDGGHRLRVAGMVDLAGFSTDMVASRIALLGRQGRAAFPAGGDWERAQTWTGLRPATPDWKPIIGPSGVDGLWLATGLGGLGFTISCGTGHLLAAMISGREPAIPVSPYAFGGARFARAA